MRLCPQVTRGGGAATQHEPIGITGHAVANDIVFRRSHLDHCGEISARARPDVENGQPARPRNPSQELRDVPSSVIVEISQSTVALRYREEMLIKR
jgi:hypothetical protein